MCSVDRSEFIIVNTLDIIIFALFLPALVRTYNAGLRIALLLLLFFFLLGH
jgi:hypothetical protein